jgi:hypothetical protein
MLSTDHRNWIQISNFSFIFTKADCCFVSLKQIEEPPRAKPTHINAFQLIGMASSLDLSGFFEEEVCTLSG